MLIIFVSGISGRALQSVHHGFALTQKRFNSSTCGHSHLFDYHLLRDSSGSQRQGLVCRYTKTMLHHGQESPSVTIGPSGVCIKEM